MKRPDPAAISSLVGACLVALAVAAPERARGQAVLSETSSAAEVPEVDQRLVATVPMSLLFEGNVVIIPEVYKAVLQYAGWDSAPRDVDARCRWIEETVEDFLHASGYDLASVVVVHNQDNYELLIDEGRLDKIIFRNVDPWTTVQLIFLLDLPGHVFNRDLVDRGLHRVREKISMRSVKYEVVPVDEPDHERLQIDNPTIIEGLTLLKPGEPHELIISFEQADRREGMDLGLGVQPPDGLVVEGGYLWSGFLAEGDRFEIGGQVGVRLSDIGRVPGNRLGISRAGALTAWSTPVIANFFRFTTRVEADMEARRREDLGLVNYFFLPVRGGVGLLMESERLSVSVGGGVTWRSFFAARREEGEAVPVLDVTEGTNLRGFAEAELLWTLNPYRLRRDRPHELRLEGRLLWPLSSADGDISETFLSYRNTVTLGFDEIVYAVRGAWLAGQVPFYSEVPMGDGFLRSAFQGTVFARQVASINLEYRFSLSRDNLKLGVFNDIVMYDALDELRGSDGVSAIDNLGLGLHILVLDAFQFSGYFGAGIRTDGELDLGFSLDVSQAF